MGRARHATALLVIVIGCAFGQAQSTASTAKPIFKLPSTFVGVIPCADCPGIRETLNLNADHTFLTRLTYLGRDGSFFDRGQWELSADGKTLTLRSGKDTPQQLRVVSAKKLRLLDGNGHEIKSKMNFDLTRASKIDPFSDYTAPAAKLEDTEWKLVEVGGKPVKAAGDHPPQLRLTADNRAQGFAGCNNFSGKYELNGSSLKLGPLAATRKFCAENMDQETAFLHALDSVTTFKLSGKTLELYNGEKVVARLTTP